MGDELKEPQTSGTDDPKTPEAPAPEPEEKRDDVSIKDGIVTMPESNYNALTGMKNDMLKYKEKAKAIEAELEKIKAAQLETEKKKLEEDKKFEELYNQEKQANVDLQTQIVESAITNALKVKALAEGIVDVEYIKLCDKSQVKRDEDSGEISGVDETIKAFKEKNPALFKDGSTVPVDTGKGGKSSGVLTDDDLRNWTSKDIKDAKKNNPGLYERWQKIASQGKPNPKT